MPDRELDFVMGYVEHSEAYKNQFKEIWIEVLANVNVNPLYAGPSYAASPYYKDRRRRYGMQDQIILKDPETHKAVMTFAAKLVRALFGDPDGEYINCKPRGYEDAGGAMSVAKLLRYAFGLEGHYRTINEGVFEMLCIGTSVLEIGYKYQEREMPVRTVSTAYGVETSDETRTLVPTWDDVTISVVPFDRFYPDPSESRIEAMSGAAKGFDMTPVRADALARQGIYDSAAVRDAVSKAPGGTQGTTDNQTWRENVDLPSMRTAPAAFKKMRGYEYWGEVPWVGSEGSSRRVITVLNGTVVRDRPFPFADYCLPFRSLIIAPQAGCFYGKAPAEVIRYDQDFADALKMLIAEAVVRSVHPPIAFDNERELDVQLLKKWHADMPIGIGGGPASVATLRYDANINAAMGMAAQLKDSMQSSSGAPGGIQGEAGPSREAASVGTMRIQAAMDQPELAALLLERECLPAIGRSILSRYQQFLDTEGLQARIGSQPQPVWIGSIQGDFDIQFVGSRQAISRQEKLQAWDRIISYAGAVPGFQMMLPNVELAKEIVGDLLQLPEVAAQVGSQQNVITNVLSGMLAGRAGRTGNGNGATIGSAPSMMPAQAAGGIGAG